MVMNPEWINTVSYTPLLRHTILTPLLSEYVPDGVGISPTTVHHMAISMVTSQQQQQQAGSPTTATKPKNGKFIPHHDEYFCLINHYATTRSTGHSSLVGMAGVMGIHRVTCDPLHPFNHPKEGPRARAFTPDNMEPDEIEVFPEYYKLVQSCSEIIKIYAWCNGIHHQKCVVTRYHTIQSIRFSCANHAI